MRRRANTLVGSATLLVSCALIASVFWISASGEQPASISGVVLRVGGLPVPQVEVRIEGAGAALSSDSGEFVLPMTPNLHVGMAAVFHVKEWVILKPCENKMGRAYLRDPSAEPIELLVLPLNDPKLKSPRTQQAMKMIECLLVEEASRFPQKPSSATAPRTSLLQQPHPISEDVDDRKYLAAHPEPHLCAKHCYFIAAAFQSPTSGEDSRVPAATGPTNTGDQVKDEFLDQKARELGLSGDELRSAIEEWGKSVEDPYQKGLAAFHAHQYAQASQYIAASIPSPPGALLGRYIPLARVEYEQGHFRAAETALRKVLAVHGDDPVVLNNLALTLTAQAKYSEAELLLKKGLSIDENARGADNPEVGTLLNSLGTLYFDQGRYREAEPLFKQALTIYENAFGEDYPANGVILNNLGMIYQVSGSSVDANLAYRHSWRILEKAGGPDNTVLADTLSNLADLLVFSDGLWHSENEDLAEKLLTRALAIDEKVLGPEHPSVAIDLGRLGFLYAAEGKTAEGFALLNKAVAMDEKVLGPSHPEVASLLSRMGLLSFYGGKYGEAEKFFRRALTIEQKALGPNHPQIAVDADSLAQTLRKLERYKEAAVYEDQAAAIRAKRKQ